MLKLAFILLLCLPLSLAARQYEKRPLTKQDEEKGIYGIYILPHFEVFVRLTLYKNHRFEYLNEHIGRSISVGKWTMSGNVIVLNSDIDSNNIPVKVYYFDTDSAKAAFLQLRGYVADYPPVNRTKFLMLFNLKNESIPDGMARINNDSTYCFPYFDTCIGSYNRIERVRFTFGGNNKSKWIPIVRQDFMYMLCIAQVDFLLSEYIPIRNYRLKISGSKLNQLTKMR
jgi:hypothetical protein